MPRIITDRVLGVVDLDALEADLNAKNTATNVVTDNTVSARVAHFDGNGTQLRASLARLRDAMPDRFPTLLADARRRGDFILPEGCHVIACGARLCITSMTTR